MRVEWWRSSTVRAARRACASADARRCGHCSARHAQQPWLATFMARWHASGCIARTVLEAGSGCSGGEPQLIMFQFQLNHVVRIPPADITVVFLGVHGVGEGVVEGGVPAGDHWHPVRCSHRAVVIVARAAGPAVHRTITMAAQKAITPPPSPHRLCPNNSVQVRCVAARASLRC